MKKSHLSVYILFLLSAFTILLNRYTSFYLSDYRLHFFFLFVAAASFVIIAGHLFKKLRTTRAMLLTFLVVGILCFAKGFLTWGGDWKTQTVLYQNLENSAKTVDFQMRADRFSFGYKKRVVIINHVVPGMQWVTDIDTSAINTTVWKKVNIYVNEMKLPTE